MLPLGGGGTNIKRSLRILLKYKTSLKFALNQSKALQYTVCVKFMYSQTSIIRSARDRTNPFE